jgi:hypothetical protein
VIHVPMRFVYTQEPCYLGAELAWREQTERGLAFDLAHKREFCSWLEANGHIRLVRCAKAAGEPLPESGGDKLIAHFSRA